MISVGLTRTLFALGLVFSAAALVNHFVYAPKASRSVRTIATITGVDAKVSFGRKPDQVRFTAVFLHEGRAYVREFQTTWNAGSGPSPYRPGAETLVTVIGGNPDRVSLAPPYNKGVLTKFLSVLAFTFVFASLMGRARNAASNNKLQRKRGGASERSDG